HKLIRKEVISMTNKYFPGEPIPAAKPPEPSKAALEHQLVAIRERQSEIRFLLGEGVDERGAQQLQQEHSVLGDSARDVVRKLTPPAKDAELAKLHAANIAAQVAEAKQDEVTPPEVIEERKQNAAKRREAILELQYAEESEVLRNQIRRFEAQGEFAQAGIMRAQLIRLREDIERRA